jgi:hypothetical protein
MTDKIDKSVKAELIKRGKDMTRIGLVMFVVAAVFFELVIGISGHSLGRYSLPLLLIVLGVFLLIRNALSKRPTITCLI